MENEQNKVEKQPEVETEVEKQPEIGRAYV